MKSLHTNGRLLPLAIALGVAAVTAACGSKEPAGGEQAAAQGPAANQPSATPGTEPMGQAAALAAQSVVGMTWTPEALEELLAPIALYPDSMLAQVLIASANPQEVLDAGNWLLQNQNLKGKALDEAALKVGFTPPIRALLQFPETVDMMCMQLDWTTELGQAFTADQQGVLDAVQRLRKQAQDVGNLKSSPQLKVETEQQNGEEVVTVSSPNPNVVYVPQYDPVAVYAPAPATTAAAPAPAPATTTTTTTTTESSGYSTGALITTGLLAFGAGMLVNEVFDDDEDDYWHNHNYYYPNYGYGGMPYYPPYPYRPAYGNGYYPANGYNRPPNYQHGFNNNNVVVINNGQNNYWNDRSKRATTYQRSGGTYEARSPITSAKPNRPELQQLNQRQPKPMPADVKRPSNTATASNWKGQSSYAGAKGGAAKTAGAARPAATTQPARPAPKVQGSYGGASPDRARAAQGGYAGAQPDRAKPAQGGYAGAQTSRSQATSREDRGYGQPQAAPRPQQAAKPAQQPRPQAQPSRPQGGGGGGRQNAMAGSDRGAADRQASQRGKQSMPQGARSKGGGGGGGGGKKGKR